MKGKKTTTKIFFGFSPFSPSCFSLVNSYLAKLFITKCFLEEMNSKASPRHACQNENDYWGIKHGAWSKICSVRELHSLVWKESNTSVFREGRWTQGKVLCFWNKPISSEIAFQITAADDTYCVSAMCESCEDSRPQAPWIPHHRVCPLALTHVTLFSGINTWLRHNVFWA